MPGDWSSLPVVKQLLLAPNPTVVLEVCALVPGRGPPTGPIIAVFAASIAGTHAHFTYCELSMYVHPLTVCMATHMWLGFGLLTTQSSSPEVMLLLPLPPLLLHVCGFKPSPLPLPLRPVDSFRSRTFVQYIRVVPNHPRTHSAA